MKLSHWLSLAVLVGVPAASATAASSGRTNINPALVYYEAFLLFPDFSVDERNYLFLRNWEGRTLEPRLGELLSRYDGAFGLLRQAAGLSVPCDWGLNLAEGPFQELPRLPKAKHLAQMALLDVSCQLQNGHPAEARADLLGVVALARNLSQDDLIVSALVRIAIEALVTHSIAAHFYQLDVGTLEAVSQALEQDHGSLVARCIPTENLVYRRWYVDALKRLRQENPGNDKEVLRRVRQLLVPPGESETQSTAGLDLWEEWVQAAGGTSAGLLQLFSREDALDEAMAPIMDLPYTHYVARVEPLLARAKSESAPLSRHGEGLDRTRRREFAASTRGAMVRAALAYKRRGAEGATSVMDPCGTGPFAFRRVVVEGVDRGFQLISAAGTHGPVTLVFLEKSGIPLFLDGPRAGQAAEPQDANATEKAFLNRYGFRSSETNR